MQPENKRTVGKWIRWLFSVLAFSVVLYLFWPLIGELKNIASLLRSARWDWIGMAAGIQFISYMFLAQLNRSLLSPFAGRIGLWRMMAVLPAMAFIEVAIPSAGLSGVVLRARLLGKHGYSFEVSSFTLLMETVYLGAVMLVVSLAGVWYLLNSGGVHARQLFDLVLILIPVAVTGTALYRLLADRGRGLAWVEKMVVYWNQLAGALKRSFVSLEDVLQRAEQFYDGFDHLKNVPGISLLGLSIGRVTLDVATLGACFAAFHHVLPPGILLTGYGLVLVLSGLAALPGGLGMVDVSLAVIFSRLGAPGAVAVAAALCYRLLAFWFVRFVGFVSWQMLEGRS